MSTHDPVRRPRFKARWQAVAVVLLSALMIGSIGVSTASRRFYPDDPLQREPESQDASKASPWDIDLFYDLAYGLFVTPRREPSQTRAGNVNTIDEVPDSSWFTNRIGARELSIDDLTRGANAGPPPDASHWTVIREKSSGFAAGFTAQDAAGQTWFMSFDAPSNPSGATAAIVIASRIFWALGYNQIENFVTEVRRENVTIGETATVKRPSGKRTPFTESDLDEIFERVAKNPDGSYRAVAGRLLPGKILGGFRYQGTRPDDPNDIVPHEMRRELRALRVFGAWTNLTDMKAGNTLDTVIVQEDGRSVVRHYLQDVGSTFGIGANGPHDWNEGWEYVHDGPAALKRLVSWGFNLSPWQTADYEPIPSVGRFEGDSFDPDAWKPRTATGAYMEMRDDDAFWAAMRVMSFSDDAIRAIVRSGQLGDERAEKYMSDVLIKRRNKIGSTYLTRLNPVVHPQLDASNVLTFGNAAVQLKLAEPPTGYTCEWFAFDNATGESTPLGATSGASERLEPPANLPSRAGTFVRADIAAQHPTHGSWKQPVQAFFEKRAEGWRLVGFERMPAAGAAATGKGTAAPRTPSAAK